MVGWDQLSYAFSYVDSRLNSIYIKYMKAQGDREQEYEASGQWAKDGWWEYEQSTIMYILKLSQ